MTPTSSTADPNAGPPSAEARGDSVRALEEVIAPVTAAIGFETLLVEWFGSGRGRGLRVFIDHPDGVSLDDCTRLSPVIGNALAAAEEGPDAPAAVASALRQPYTLEVSSPGIERPLAKRSHFERFAQRRVKIRTFEAIRPGSNQRTFHGIIERVEPDPGCPADERSGTVHLRPLDDGPTVAIQIGQIRRANLVYEG